MTKEIIEDNLKKYLGVQKIIWLPRGLYGTFFAFLWHVMQFALFSSTKQTLCALPDGWSV